jgi:hypothetical protein
MWLWIALAFFAGAWSGVLLMAVFAARGRTSFIEDAEGAYQRRLDVERARIRRSTP